MRQSVCLITHNIRKFFARAVIVSVLLASAGPIPSKKVFADSMSTSAGNVATQVAAGDAHTCALLTSGIVQCWGDNSSGQLGDGTTTDRHSPVNVTGLPVSIVSISAGLTHTCAIAGDGSAWCWGSNVSKQLGGGAGATDLYYTIPIQVTGLGNVATISAGGLHTCAILQDGTGVCWGSNTYGQLGDGTRLMRASPISIQGLQESVLEIATGTAHSCALLSSGAVKCWGSNYYKELGDGGMVNWSSLPMDVFDLQSGVVSLSSRSRHTCAKMSSGNVKCWGVNQSGQLGDATLADSYIPVDVNSLSGAVKVVAGGAHTCALVGLLLKCWGDNYYGQLGNAQPMYQSISKTPVQVYGVYDATSALALGSRHSCVLISSGGVKCWGDNAHGQLGNDSIAPSSVPVDALGFEPPSLRRWTLMLYLDGDTAGLDGGTIYSEFARAIQQLGRVSKSNVNVVALIDGPNFLDTFRVTFQPGVIFEPLGEKAMDNPATLVDFVNKARQDFPADYYYLAIADHANGLRGIAWDTTSDVNRGAMLTPPELRQALSQITGNGAAPIDVLHFDGCSFGMMENASVADGFVRYLVVSQNIGWSVFAYDYYRDVITATTSPSTFAASTAARYGLSVQRAGGYPFTISALDMGQYGRADQALSDFSRELITYAQADPANKSAVAALRGPTQKFDSTSPTMIIDNNDFYLDLTDYARRVHDNISNQAVVSASVVLINALTASPFPFVIYNASASGTFQYAGQSITWNLANANGVSIYYPAQMSGSNYQNYVNGAIYPEFKAQTQWDDYLVAMAVSALPGDPVDGVDANPLPPLRVVQPRSFLPNTVRENAANW